jgi:hypothetical protein
VYELSLIESVPNIKEQVKKEYGWDVNFERAKHLPRGERRRRQHLQGHRQARAHRHGRRRRDHHDLLDHHGPHAGAHMDLDKLSMLHPAFPARSSSRAAP